MTFPIKAFTLKGSAKNDKIEMLIEEVYDFPDRTSHLGGYDFRGTVNIQIGSFMVNDARIFSSTGTLYRLFTALQQCYHSLEGTATFCNYYESEFTFHLNMIKLGHAVISGEYQQYLHLNTKLIFEMETDQTCILATIQDLQHIIRLFGDEFGKRLGIAQE